MKNFINDYLIPTAKEVIQVILAIGLYLLACVAIALLIFAIYKGLIHMFGLACGIILSTMSIILISIVLISVVKYIKK